MAYLLPPYRYTCLLGWPLTGLVGSGRSGWADPSSLWAGSRGCNGWFDHVIELDRNCRANSRRDYFKETLARKKVKIGTQRWPEPVRSGPAQKILWSEITWCGAHPTWRDNENTAYTCQDQPLPRDAAAARVERMWQGYHALIWRDISGKWRINSAPERAQ